MRKINVLRKKLSKFLFYFAAIVGLISFILQILLQQFVNASMFINSSDGQVVRAYTSGAVDSSLIQRLVETMTFLLDAQHYGYSVENKPASLFVLLE